MTDRSRKWIRIAARVCVSVAVGLAVIYKLKVAEILSVFQHASWYMMVGTAALSPTIIVLLAWRLKTVFRDQGIILKFKLAVSVTWVGQFFNTFLPGSAGGDLYKMVALKNSLSRTSSEAAIGVVVDRVVAMTALLALACLAAIAEPEPLLAFLHSSPTVSRVLVLSLAASAICLVLLYLARDLAGKIIPGLASYICALRKIALEFVSSLHFSKRILFAFVLAGAAHLFNFTVVFFLARSLRIAITFEQICLMMPVLLLVVFLPLSINGHGLREMVLVAYFALFAHSSQGCSGSTREQAFALSAAIVVNDLFCAAPGGIWFILSKRSNAIPLTDGNS